VTQEFLFCRSCGVLCALDVIGAAWGGAENEETAPDEDLQQFEDTHRQHMVVRAARLSTPAIHDRAVWDPMGTMWFEVGCGLETFVVRASRTSIDSPRLYEFVPGSIQSGKRSVEIDEPYLRSALDRHFFPQLLQPATVDGFVTLLHSLVQETPTGIETSFDDVDDPSVGIAPLPDDLYRQLTARSAEIFDRAEVDRIASFIDTNRFEDGALALHVRSQPAVLAA